MPRLTDEQWEKVKADWATGKYSFMELSSKHKVSNAAICKKAKAEGWQRLDPELVDAFINIKSETALEVNKVAKVNSINSAYLQNSLDALAEAKMRIHEDMTEIRKMMMDVIRERRDAGELSTIDCKIAMETAAKEHEVKFGKTPDTAIQINNQSSNQLPSVIEIVAPE